MGRGDAAPTICVEVAYSPCAGQVQRLALTLPAGATVAEAIAQANARCGGSLPAQARIGIWGRLRADTDALRDNDRIEIYRPLTVDPKEARRQRYRSHRAAKKA